MGSSTRWFWLGRCAKAWPKYSKVGAGSRLSSPLDGVTASLESVGAFWPNWRWTLCPLSRTGCRTYATSRRLSLRDHARQSAVFSGLSSLRSNAAHLPTGTSSWSIRRPRLPPTGSCHGPLHTTERVSPPSSASTSSQAWPHGWPMSAAASLAPARTDSPRARPLSGNRYYLAGANKGKAPGATLQENEVETSTLYDPARGSRPSGRRAKH